MRQRSDLARRLVCLMVNEAARCLEEKVVATPEDADYGMVLGTGFRDFSRRTVAVRGESSA